MNIFDIMGPIMVGPSSSHTAGAVRIGLMARQLLKDNPMKAEIGLFGSFATTGYGHGTQQAIIAGLLNMEPQDIRIPKSFELAREQGLNFEFHTVSLNNAHPNSVLMNLTGTNGRELEIQASSIGGGQIVINKLDGITVNFSGDKPTLIIHNMDQPGHVAEVTSMLSHKSINIATMQLYRDKRGGYAVMVLELDQTVPEDSIKWLEHLEGVIKVTYINGGMENGI